MRRVVITGGSRGIGAATVRRFTAAGDQVYFLYEKSTELARQLEQETGAVGIPCDISQEDAVNRAFQQIGPVDVLNARERIEVHALLTNNTFSSWQRMTSRLVLHGPVTPLVPSSMLQLMKTQVYVSEEIAAPFECWEKVGY